MHTLNTRELREMEGRKKSDGLSVESGRIANNETERNLDYAKLLHKPGSGSRFLACIICNARSRPRPSPSGSMSSSALCSIISFGSSGRGGSGTTLGLSDLVEFLDARGGAINSGSDRAISSGGSNEVQPRG